MPTYTKNYNLIKPHENEYYNIGDFNGNADLIDAAIEAARTDNAGALSSVPKPLASWPSISAICMGAGNMQRTIEYSEGTIHRDRYWFTTDGAWVIAALPTGNLRAFSYSFPSYGMLTNLAGHNGWVYTFHCETSGGQQKLTAYRCDDNTTQTLSSFSVSGARAGDGCIMGLDDDTGRIWCHIPSATSGYNISVWYDTAANNWGIGRMDFIGTGLGIHFGPIKNNRVMISHYSMIKFAPLTPDAPGLENLPLLPAAAYPAHDIVKIAPNKAFISLFDMSEPMGELVYDMALKESTYLPMFGFRPVAGGDGYVITRQFIRRIL